MEPRVHVKEMQRGSAPVEANKDCERSWLCQRVVETKTAHPYRKSGFGPPEGARSRTPLSHTPEKPRF